LSRGWPTRSTRPAPPALDVVAAACADAGDVAHVELIAARMPNDAEVTRQLAIACARAGRYEEAVMHAPDERTTIDVARVLAEDGQAARALALIETIPERVNESFHRIGVLASMAASATDPGDARIALERARAAVDTIASTTYRAMAYAEVARAEAGGDAAAARVCFERAVELANTPDETVFLPLLGPSPRFSALKVIADRMTDAGFVDMAIAVARTVVNEKDDEWKALHASVIAAVAVRRVRSGPAGEKAANLLFDEARAAARRARDSFLGPPWHVIALHELANRLAEAGRLRAAFEAISEAHFTLDPFMIGVAGWADTLDRRSTGLSLAVTAAAAQVFGWQRPDWAAVAELIGATVVATHSSA
jgi:hypothetical protein